MVSRSAINSILGSLKGNHIEPPLKPDVSSVTFIIWFASSTRNLILLYTIWSALYLNCFINFSLSASSVLICLVNSTFWIFNIFSSCSIASLISSYFISWLSVNPAFYFISLHTFVITHFFSIYLPIWIFSSLGSRSHLPISFSELFWHETESENHGLILNINSFPLSTVYFIQPLYYGPQDQRVLIVYISC